MANLYDQYLYKPTNKEQLGLGIGSLISAALASMGGNNTREALIRAAAGGLAGYGSGWKGMQDQYGEVFRRAMEDRQLQNQEQSMAIRNALGIENQGLRREQFEANKNAGKYKEGKQQSGMGRMNEYTAFQGMTPEDQSSYLEYLGKTGYNRVLGMNEAGEPIFAPTRGNVQLKTPIASPGMAVTQKPPVSGKDIQPFIKPVLAESAQENIARGDTLQQNINRVKGLYDKTFVGAGDALQGKAGEIYGGATNDKEKNFRSAVNSLYTNMFAEGGKALTENEKEILKPLFPSFWRGEENFLIDLGGLETKYRELMQARLQTHKGAGMRNIDNVQKGLTLPINQIQTADDFINLLEGK